MTSAIFGLIGVLLGSILAGAKEWWFQRRNNSKDAAYLAVQVVGLLDRYVLSCSSVAEDNGLNRGEPDERGCRTTQTEPLQFRPDSLKVEWRSIPVDLMYDILDLPYKALVAEEMVAAAGANSDPPDYEDFFEERQLQYARLGLLAAQLASRLRAHVGLPVRSVCDWNPLDFMERRQSKIESMRAERAKRWKLQIPSTPSDA
ncbi:MAG: hypothetical protein WC782_16065 [Methylococcaceae bacterium]|jgi:hypothetical protein